jgi:hypothetical protein
MFEDFIHVVNREGLVPKSSMDGLPRALLLAVLAVAAFRAALRGQEVPSHFSPPPEDAAVTSDPQFEHGQPRKVVDAVGWVFGIPKKIILWDRRAVNHHVSAETERNLAQYLDANGLATTKVRINEYDPVGEWRRLGANKQVGAGWRYTIGAFDTLVYTVVPGRLFGADRYNPYTDSVYIYSDIPCLAQEQASYAKLVHARPHPGTYAAVSSLPIVQLWPEKQAKREVLDYTLMYGTPAQQTEATRVLYAEYGAEIGGQASLLVGSNLPLVLAGAGIGHVAARLNPTTTDDMPPAPPSAVLSASHEAEIGPSTLKR